MKKFFAIISSVILLASCNDSLEVDVQYQLTADIDVMNVVRYMKDTSGSLIYNNGDLVFNDEYIVLVYMLYNADGNLIAEERMKLGSFSEKTNITKSLTIGDYTIVICTYIGDSELEWWNLTGKENIDNLKIRYFSGRNYINILSGVLGFHKQSISINKSENISISVPSAVSFVSFDFQNLSSAGIATVDLYVKTWNDFLNAADGKANVLELANSLNWELNRDMAYTNRLTYLHYLPAPRYILSWQGLNAAGNAVRGPFDIPGIAIVAGKTYYVRIDGNSGQATISEL